MAHEAGDDNLGNERSSFDAQKPPHPSHLPVILRRPVDGVLRLGNESVHFGFGDDEGRGAHHRVADRAQHDDTAAEAVVG